MYMFNYYQVSQNPTTFFMDAFLFDDHIIYSWLPIRREFAFTFTPAFNKYLNRGLFNQLLGSTLNSK